MERVLAVVNPAKPDTISKGLTKTIHSEKQARVRRIALRCSLDAFVYGRYSTTCGHNQYVQHCRGCELIAEFVLRSRIRFVIPRMVAFADNNFLQSKGIGREPH